jgi:hypothetical protein
VTIIERIKQMLGLYQPAHIKANREPLRCPYCGDLYNSSRCAVVDIDHGRRRYSKSSCDGRRVSNDTDSSY